MRRGRPAPSPVVSMPVPAIFMRIVAEEWVIELKINQSVELRIISKSPI